jgi:ISXO2-like transposase domain
MKEQIAADTHIATDEAGQYLRVGKHLTSHGAVNHGAGEYVRGQIHTNWLESYFSISKRGLVGTFHHVGPQH